MIKRIILSVILVSLAGSAIAAEDVAVRASVDRKTITIGDRIKYKIAVACPKGFEVEPLKFKDNKTGEFEIKDFESKRGVNVYFLTAYSPGAFSIPPAEIRYRRAGAKEWSVKRTDPIKITIASVLPKDRPAADIKEIKGPLSFREFPAVPVISALAAILALAVIFMWYRQKRLRALLKTPYEMAMEGLDRSRRGYGENGDIKEYYAGISDSVRRYIERRFSVKAPEMTTEEFLGSLEGSDALPEGHRRLLGIFLTACDMVKFAKYVPRHDEMESVFTTAKNFIEETRPKVKDK